ncbi:MAG: hypothetical protein E7000_04375 [Coriobacteriaceae bacterium]|nr:hypothetical protein [Coriobacteriaceae bacterium]
MKKRNWHGVLSAFLAFVLVAGLSPASALAVQDNASTAAEDQPAVAEQVDENAQGDLEAAKAQDEQAVQAETPDEAAASEAVEAQDEQEVAVEPEGVEEEPDAIPAEEPKAAEQQDAAVTTQSDDDEEEDVGIWEADISLDKRAFEYDGKPHAPEVKITYGGKTLVEGTDYELSYIYWGIDDDRSDSLDEPQADCGYYDIIIKGMGRFTSSDEYGYQIFDRFDLASLYATMTDDSFFEGAIPSDFGVTVNPKDENAKTQEDKTLAKGKDYTISYMKVPNGQGTDTDYVDYSKFTAVKDISKATAGSYCVMLTGAGSYHGQKALWFSVKSPKNIGYAEVKVANEPVVNNASEKVTPSFVVTLKGKLLRAGTDYTVTYQRLNDDSDYDASILTAPLSAGKYVAIIEGKGSYTGFTDCSFKIKDTLDLAYSTLEYEQYVAETGKPIGVTGLKVYAADGTLLKSGADYKLKYYSYSYDEETDEEITEEYDAPRLSDAGSRVYFTVTGCGKYHGDQTGAYRIVEKNSLRLAKVAFAGGATEVGYTGKDIPFVVTFPGAKTPLKAGVDYDIDDIDFNSPESGWSSESAINKVGTYDVEITAHEGGKYTGWASATLYVKPDVSKAKVTVASGKYTGKALTPEPKVELGGTVLIKDVDYTVSYKNNVKAGKKASVVITGTGDYTGTASKAFTIAKAKNPLKVKASSKVVKAKTVKKKAKTMKAIKVLKKAGKVTYSKVKKGSAKQLSVSKKNGKITVAKGTKKGTYTIKVKVKAKGNANYKAASKVVKVKVKVK